MARQNQKFCNKVRERAERWHTYFGENISTYRSMFEFVLGDQNKDEDKRDESYPFQRIPFNKLAPINSNIIGEYIFNTPNLQVVPISKEASPDEIALREDVVTGIAFTSESKTIYRHAAQQVFVGGFGAILVENVYESDESFNQTIRISKVNDPTKCFWDTSAEEPTKSDGLYAGSYSLMDRKDFSKKYPNVKNLATINAEKINNFSWVSDDTVAILDYFEKKLEYRGKLLLLDDGSKITEKEYNEIVRNIEEEVERLNKSGFDLDNDFPRELIAPTVLAEKEYTEWKIMRYKIVGNYILEESEYPAKEIGLVFLTGESYMDSKNGKQVTRSFFKYAKEPQRVLNFLNSQIVDLVKKLRHDQWMAPLACVAKNSDVWKNVMNEQGCLTYDPLTVNGALLKPEKVPPSQISPTLQQEYNRVLEDISTCLGIYDTQLGDQGNEVSGVAINARTARGNLRTLPTYEMINIGIAQVGNLILQMIPNVFDTNRFITLSGPGGFSKAIEINKPMEFNGVVNGLTEGEYRINIIPGRSREGQKHEDLYSLQLLLQYDPKLFAMVADLLAESLPMGNTTEVVNRMRSLVPPRVIAEGKGRPLPPEEEQPNPAVILLQKRMEEMQNDIDIKQRDMQLKEQKLMAETELRAEKQELERDKLELDKVKSQIDAAKAASEIQKNKDEMGLKTYNSMMGSVKELV